jgi:HEAT repeat protein
MKDLAALLAELTSGDDERAEAAVPGLAAHGLSALPALKTLLNSPEVDDRWWAVRSLAQFPESQSALLLQALADPASEVRQCAALALCAHPQPGNVAALVEALADPDRMVASLAGNALIAVGQPAVPALLEAWESAPQNARMEAVRVLAEIADPRAIPALMAALEDDSAFMQHWAEAGLERLGMDMIYFKPD